MEKLLSVVVPTYNMEKYLPRCLDSLIIEDKELFDKLEVLVINDGSKDNSLAIAKDYELKYPDTFRVIDKENGNYGSCVNKGLKEAKGKYIKILDADDYFDNICFSRYLCTISKFDYDLIINDCHIVSTTGEVLSCFSFKIPKIQEDEMLLIPTTIQMHCVAYKTKKLREINYIQTEGISYTDQEWIFMPMTTVYSVYYIKEPLYNYLIGRNGQTMDSNVYIKHFGEDIFIVKRMLCQYYSANIKYGKVKKYLYCKIEDRIHTIYRNVIVDAGYLKNSELIAFDEMLSETYPEYYKDVVMNIRISRIIPFKFIRSWKNNNHNLSSVSPFLLLYKAKSYIKKNK